MLTVVLSRRKKGEKKSNKKDFSDPHKRKQNAQKESRSGSRPLARLNKETPIVQHWGWFFFSRRRREKKENSNQKFFFVLLSWEMPLYRFWFRLCLSSISLSRFFFCASAVAGRLTVQSKFQKTRSIIVIQTGLVSWKKNLHGDKFLLITNVFWFFVATCVEQNFYF